MGSSLPFDPFGQSFTLRLSDSTPFNVSVPDLDEFITYNVQICINYAAQLGGSFVLLIVLLLLTKPEKRQSPIFLLNCFSLTLNVIRNVLQCLYFTGPFSETYAYFGQDYSRVTASTYATSVTATVLTFLLLVCVEISLILQVHVVCVTLRESYRHAIFMSSNLISLMAVGFRFALCVENSRFIVTLIPLSDLNWLESAANITTSISICWFCAVFVGKLAFALYERKKLGLGAWGPMHIIFVMGCQTLIIPAIFSILQYFTPFPAMSSNVLTLITIFLPLSSLWASASVTSRGKNAFSQNPHSFRQKLLGSYASGSTAPFVGHKIHDGPISPSFTVTTRASQMSIPQITRTDATKDLENQDSVAGRGG